MKQNLKLLVVLLLFMVPGANMWSATRGMLSSDLSVSSSKTDPKLNGFPKPSKSPARFVNSLTFYYNSKFQDLIFTGESGTTYVFIVSDESGCVVLQGYLDFSVFDTIGLNADFLQRGDYFVNVTNMSNNEQFLGNFSIE